MSTAVNKIVPLADRVLVKRAVVEAKTASGIILSAPKQKINEGEVVAVGPGAFNRDGKLIPVSVQVGDRVMLPEYGGHVIEIGEEAYTLFRDEDILAKLQ